MMQIITKNNKVVCVTSVPYDKDTIKCMKNAGYKIKEVADDKKEGWRYAYNQTKIYHRI